MEAVVLAGIARRVLDELMRNPYRTIELRGARNVLAVEEALERTMRLFLTYDPFSDVEVGTEGLLAELLGAERLETRVPWGRVTRGKLLSAGPRSGSWDLEGWWMSRTRKALS